jgi:hypothetical protein
MYDGAARSQAAALLAAGLSLNAVSKQLGMSRAALRDWRDHPARVGQRSSECPRCQVRLPLDPHAYSHLLGLYLGGGCVSLLKKEVYSLRITCDQRYPKLIAEARGSLIIGLCTWALDLLDIAWRMTRPNCISLARQAAVAALDVHVGPKT